MARFLEELTEKIKQQTERSKQKQFDKGRAEASAEWNNWLDRKEAAEAKGEPFDEPRPGNEEAEGHIEEESDQKMSDESAQYPLPKVWTHSVGQAEFILQPLSDSLVRVTHRDQVGYIGISLNWDVGRPYSWKHMDRTAGVSRAEVERTVSPDGIHGNPFGEPTPEAALNVLCDLQLQIQRKEDSQRDNPEKRKQAARKVLREFLDELPDWEAG